MGTWLWEHIKSEWGVLTAAPVAFSTLLVGGLLVGGSLSWFLLDKMYVREIATLSRELEVKNGTIQEYQDRLEDRMNRIERRLDEQQEAAIRKQLSGAPSDVSIAVGDGDDDPFASQLIELFKESGWNVDASVKPSESDTVVLPKDREAAETIQRAFRDAGIAVSEEAGSDGTLSYGDFLDLLEPERGAPQKFEHETSGTENQSQNSPSSPQMQPPHIKYAK
ncbi:hypothetical protein [Nitratireductor sp. CH_MIT9313-5]|uniref:hypothetical protein n=1 Tax=Nitratireductor sp. CH_MIT9313-5 TaxID=3107764 RepID=UPI00300A60C2